MLTSEQLQGLGEAELRTLAQDLLARLSHSDSEILMKDRKLVWSEARIDQLTHEIAVLKRWKFSARSEQLDDAQKSLLDESVDADIAAVELELDLLRSSSRPSDPRQPRRSHCLRTCHARRSTTSLNPSPASAAVRCTASART